MTKKYWNDITEEEIDNCEHSSNYEESLRFLLKQKQERRNAMEAERVKAGNRLMSYITEYYLDMIDYYQDEYKENWYEAIKQDNVWNIREDDFGRLLKEYFESVIDI